MVSRKSPSQPYLELLSNTVGFSSGKRIIEHLEEWHKLGKAASVDVLKDF